MINFIIYDNDLSRVNICKEIIGIFMGDNNLNYGIYVFNNYFKGMIMHFNNEIEGKKIYLLNADIDEMSGIDLAKKIRHAGDWISQIIILSSKGIYSGTSFALRLLMLDFISDVDNFRKELTSSLDVAFNIINKQAALVFKNGSEIFQVLYSEIYYIEKNLNDNDATVFTKNNEYIVKYSINKLMDILGDDPRFFKSHRSCIINLNNVEFKNVGNKKCWIYCLKAL